MFPWAPSSARQGKGSLGIRAGAWTILEKVAPAGRPQVPIPGVRRGPRAEDTPYRRADRGRHQRGRSQACGARARTQHLSGERGGVAGGKAGLGAPVDLWSDRCLGTEAGRSHPSLWSLGKGLTEGRPHGGRCWRVKRRENRRKTKNEVCEPTCTPASWTPPRNQNPLFPLATIPTGSPFPVGTQGLQLHLWR